MENEYQKKVRVNFYMYKSEKELLYNHCQLLNLKTSPFIRNTVLEKLGKRIYTPPRLDTDTNQYLKELITQGVNLNQIAKKLNSGAQFMIADQQEVLDQIELISRQILEIKTQLK